MNTLEKGPYTSLNRTLKRLTIRRIPQRRLMNTLEKTDKGRATITILEHQHELVTFLTKLAHDIKKMRDTRQRKVLLLLLLSLSCHTFNALFLRLYSGALFRRRRCATRASARFSYYY